jgi:hypothetical protein
MDRINYSEEGWPYIETASPSFEAKAGPVISIPMNVDGSSIIGAKHRVMYE